MPKQASGRKRASEKVRRPWWNIGPMAGWFAKSRAIEGALAGQGVADKARAGYSLRRLETNTSAGHIGGAASLASGEPRVRDPSDGF